MTDAQPASPVATVKAAATRLGISERSVYRLQKDGDLRGFLVHGKRVFRVADLDAYLERLAAAQMVTDGQHSCRAATSFARCTCRQG